jgi:hypothetical protein
MLQKLSLFALTVVATFGLLHQSMARDKGAKTETVAGCLAQGDHPNEYSIKAQNGKTYGLRSSNVQLAQHLGHQVEVTGNITKEKEKAGTEAKTGKAEEDVHMNVTNLKMISTTCQ